MGEGWGPRLPPEQSGAQGQDQSLLFMQQRSSPRNKSWDQTKTRVGGGGAGLGSQAEKPRSQKSPV